MPAAARSGPPPGSVSRLAPGLTALALVGLVLAGLLGDSAAKVGLGARGWAPGALPWALGSAATTALVGTAYVLGAVGLWLGLRAPRAVPTTVVLAVAAAALLTMPIGSADHTNYAAYGRIALQGGDPWTESPIAWAGGRDPVTSAVQPPWQATPSIYGPLATLGQVLAAWLGGDNLRQVVWVWQWLIVGAWLLTRWLLRRLFPGGHGQVDLLWTLNPLVVGTGVLGAHVDTLATPLMVAALLIGRRAGWGPAALAGMAAGLAIGVKVTAGVVLVALVLGWLVDAVRGVRLTGAGRRGVGLGGVGGRDVGLRRVGLGGVGGRDVGLRRVGLRAAALAGGAAVVLAPLHVWAGPHTYEQLGRARRSISLATPWRKAYEWGGGHLPDAAWRSVIFAVAAVVCLVLAWLCWRVLCRGGSAGWSRAAGPGVGVAPVIALALSLAYAVGAPYVLPWYDQLVWALLPAALVAGRADVGAGPDGIRAPSLVLTRAWIVRGVVVALAYVPGRVVGMSPRAEELTLMWRRDVAPLAALAVWLVLVRLAARRDGRDDRESAHG